MNNNIKEYNDPMLAISFGENQEYKMIIDIGKLNKIQKFILCLLGIKISKRN